MNIEYHNWRAGALRFYQFIAEQSNVLHLPVYSDKEFIDNRFDETSNRAIERSNAACVAVREIYDEDAGKTAREYTKTTRSGRIPSSGDNRCKIWLKGYYKWLKNQYEPIAIPAVVLPDIIPDTSGWKRSFQVTGLFVVGFVLIVVYMMTGKGKKGVTVVT